MSNDIYLNRIASQHRVQPKYIAWLSVLLDKVQDLIDVAGQIDSAFDVEQAVGIQLDMIGQSVGVSRLLTFEPVYAPSALLTDEFYRTIIKARISLNQWDGTTAGIHSLWDDIFGGYTMEVVDNQNMTMTIRVYGLTTEFESEYISHGYAAPKPQGVGLNYNFVLQLELSSEIFFGGRPVNMRAAFTLRPRIFTGDLGSYGEVTVGGSVVNMRTQFTLRSTQ